MKTKVWFIKTSLLKFRPIIRKLFWRMIGMDDRQAINRNLFFETSDTKLQLHPIFFGNTHNHWNARVVILVLVAVFVRRKNMRSINTHLDGFALELSFQ